MEISRNRETCKRYLEEEVNFLSRIYFRLNSDFFLHSQVELQKFAFKSQFTDKSPHFSNYQITLEQFDINFKNLCYVRPLLFIFSNPFNVSQSFRFFFGQSMEMREGLQLRSDRIIVTIHFFFAILKSLLF